MAISPQRLTIYLYSAHRAVIFAIAQLSCLLHAFTFQVDRSLWNLKFLVANFKFESWFFVHRGQSFLDNNYPEMGSVVVLGDWVTAACAMLYCEWLLRSSCHRRLAGCSWPSGTSRLVSSILAILVPCHSIFFTATIYRGISWPWRYWYRHVSIDDKYRGIASIAQH